MSQTPDPLVRTEQSFARRGVPHSHTEPVPGCYRCELVHHEVIDHRAEQVRGIINALWTASQEKVDIIEAVLDL